MTKIRSGDNVEALRAAIQEGLDSGPAEEFNVGELIEDVKRRGRENLEARQHGAIVADDFDPTS
jgi:hypothetical protein